MKDLIINIAQILIDNNEQIDSIKTFKKGVLPPSPVFPAISISPIRETFSYQYSNSKYRIMREVRLDLYFKSMNMLTARENLRRMTSNIRDVLTDNFTINDRLYDLYIKVEDFDSPIMVGDSVIQSVSISLNGFCFDYKPDDIEIPISIVESKGNDIITQLKNLFINKKDHLNYPLNTIKSLSMQTLSPQLIFPAVLIAGPLNSDRMRNFTGMDSLNTICEISVFTKLLDKDYSLYSNLDITQNIRKVLEISDDLGGYLINSQVLTVDYLRNIHPNLGAVYHSIISLGGLMIEGVLNRVA